MGSLILVMVILWIQIQLFFTLTDQAKFFTMVEHVLGKFRSISLHIFYIQV